MIEKKQFLKGILVGIIITLVIISVTSVISTVFGYVLNRPIPFNRKVSEITHILEKYYVDDFISDDLEEGMYWGLVRGIGDPYTSYMDGKTFTLFKENTEGTYSGIGVVVSKADDERIIVVSPYEGEPGQMAGILPGDKILKVNGFDVSGNLIDEAVTMMKGPAGTKVSLTILRETDNSTFTLDITRSKIDVPTVSHKMIRDDIGYLKISQFDRVTYDQFIKAYDDLNSKNQKAMILDLRNNPGGLLDIVTKIASVLVKGNNIVYTEYKNGQKEFFKDVDERFIDIPLVLLVNSNSASASEILAGAVKDLSIGELVGITTFGKGLVQNIYPLQDGSAVKVTIARYYTPSGVCIQGTGIEPHYIVELPDNLKNEFNLADDDDLQLQKAISILDDKLN